MELWVRSQDKNNLKKVNNIYVEHITKDYDSWVGNIHCQPYVITSDNGNLGFYGTKERALEILDEIQNILKPRPFANVRPSEEMEELLGGLQHGKTLKMKNDFEYKELSTYVYEMPEE